MDRLSWLDALGIALAVCDVYLSRGDGDLRVDLSEEEGENQCLDSE